MKLSYNSSIEIIEEHLTDSNIGAGKKKAPRDHLFVLNAVINDHVNGKRKEPIDLVFYDVRQCFDSLWVSKTLLDLHENGIKDDLLNLLFEATKEAEISIKNTCGKYKEGKNL